MLFLMFLRKRLVEQTLEDVHVIANDSRWVYFFLARALEL